MKEPDNQFVVLIIWLVSVYSEYLYRADAFIVNFDQIFADFSFIFLAHFEYDFTDWIILLSLLTIWSVYQHSIKPNIV